MLAALDPGELGVDTGVETSLRRWAVKSLRCMVGRHKWHTQYTADRQPFLVCSRCRLDGPTLRDLNWRGNPDDWRHIVGGPGG
jgi:hypothetical protein